nr:ATP-binding protein [Nostoc flagelliforme]
MILSVLFAALLSFSTSRAIARPIEAVTQVARLVSNSSDFSLQVPVTTSDEIGLLSASFNNLIQTIAIYIQKLEKKNHNLEQAEEALRQGEEKFRTIVENATDIIYLLKPDGFFSYVSPNWTEILGHDIELVEGKSFHLFLHSDSLPACKNLLESLFRKNQRQGEIEYQVKHKDGSWKWHTSNLSALKNSHDEVLYFIGICRDITERKQHEEELHFWQTTIQEIFTSESFDSALLIVLQNVCIASNWNFAEAWIPRSDGTCLECSSVWYSNAESLKPFRIASEKLIFEPGIGLPGRVWLSKQAEWHQDVCPASDKTYLRTKIALESGLRTRLAIPIIADDKVLAVLVFYTFELRHPEQRLIELLSASTELGLIMQRQLIEEEISKALQQEIELSELKSRFITMTSHEFRTPLTTILSSAELLEYYSQNWSQEKKVEHLQRIQASVEQMTHLLNDVLLLGKAEAGKLQYQPCPANLFKFCSDLVEELQLGDGKKHTIEFIKKFECNTIYMDEKLLRSILSNLLSNAIKYSSKGSIVQLIVYCHLKDIVFQVKDCGIGIPAEDIPRLFDPFHRARNVNDIPGTGLGMAIVKKAVDLHRGQITVNSQIDVGTIFTVILPLK